MFIDDINISLEDNTDVLKFEENEILIFPNPSSSTLNINSLIPIDNIQIFDLSGKLIINKTRGLNNISFIDIEFLNKGFYIVVINMKSEKTTKMFMKN